MAIIKDACNSSIIEICTSNLLHSQGKLVVRVDMISKIRSPKSCKEGWFQGDQLF